MHKQQVQIGKSSSSPERRIGVRHAREGWRTVSTMSNTPSQITSPTTSTKTSSRLLSSTT